MVSLPPFSQYGTPLSQTFEKRSTGGNAGLTTGEIAGLVIGIVGVVFTAWTGERLEMFEVKKENSTPVLTSSPPPTIINHFYLYPPAISHPHSDIPADIPLSTIPSLTAPTPPAPSLQSSAP
ncbi:hypothetical protein BDD12DRAFT_908409 [Trichophaea hybrida]|nr:hypothetical protein BDD12DRAFT_908409 [Trichophaea hybrida]